MQKMKIYTFWLGPMPPYIRMCLQTFARSGYEWVLLDHSNLNDYIPSEDLSVEGIAKFPAAAQGDIVAVHMMNRYAGFFIDADTIFLDPVNHLEDLLDAHELVMIGDEKVPFCHAAFILSRGDSVILQEWEKKIGELLGILENPGSPEAREAFPAGVKSTSFGNPLLSPLVGKWLDRVKILDKEIFLPENRGLIDFSAEGRKQAYLEFYFSEGDHPIDFSPFLVLHNSWTPEWYKGYAREDIFQDGLFLSRLLSRATR